MKIVDGIAMVFSKERRGCLVLAVPMAIATITCLVYAAKGFGWAWIVPAAMCGSLSYVAILAGLGHMDDEDETGI